MTTSPHQASALVLGVDPGHTRPSALAGSVILSLDEATGRIDVVLPARPISKTALPAFLAADSLLADPRLRMVCLAAPLTPRPLERKPWKARAVEIRFSRGAFAGSHRGPGMPWIASSRMWPLYQQAVPLSETVAARGFPLFVFPVDGRPSAELPHRCTAEVHPKTTLAVLTPPGHLLARPHADKLFGQLDDWLFPRLFVDSEMSPAPIQALLQTLSPGLHLGPDAVQEGRRIAGLRRPSPRREPLRAFVAALQGILALRGAACLVGAAGDFEGSLLLPAIWHPDWEAEWNDGRRPVPQLLRLPVTLPGVPSATAEPAILDLVR